MANPFVLPAPFVGPWLGDEDINIGVIWNALVNGFPIVGLQSFGAALDGVTDDSSAINASLKALNYALIPDNVKVGVGNTIVLNSNQALIGFNFTSVLVPLNSFANKLFISLNGTNVSLANFQITSTINSSPFDGLAFIQNNSAVSQVRINGIGLNAPNHGKGLVNIVSTGVNVSDIAIQNCDVQAGFAGITFFASSFAHTASDILVTNNIISNVQGGSNNGIGISMSAAIQNAEVSNNVIGNVEFCCVEVVGQNSNINICNNVFWGTGPRGFSCTNAQTSSDVVVQGNTTDVNSAHFWEVASCPGAVICNNTIYGAVIIDCNNVWMHHNEVVSVTTSGQNGGIGLGNNSATVTGCLVENNIIDGSAGLSSSPNLLYVNGAAVTNNILRNNLLKLTPQPGNYTVVIAGATSNLFSGNLSEITGAANLGFSTAGDVFLSRQAAGILQIGPTATSQTGALALKSIFTGQTSGGQGGTFLSLSTDSNNRGQLALDGSDRASLALGPGASTALDTFLNRQAANAFGVGSSSTATDGTVIAAVFETSTALVATGGGGGNPTLTASSTGGTGQPTTAAQNSWLKMKDSGGNIIWVPVWK